MLLRDQINIVLLQSCEEPIMVESTTLNVRMDAVKAKRESAEIDARIRHDAHA